MSQLKKYSIIIGAFLALLSLSFLLGRCSTKKERSQQIANIVAARDSVKHLTIEVNGLKLDVSEKNATVLTLQDAVKAGIIEKEYLKALHLKELVTNAELQGYIKILKDSLALVPGTTIVTIKDTSGIPHDYIKLPFTLLDIKEKDVSLIAGMNINRTPYYSLNIPFAGSVTIGYKKSGFLKTTPVGIFSTDNQYLKVNQMDILIVQGKQKWYSKWWLHAIGGAVLVESARILLK